MWFVRHIWCLGLNTESEIAYSNKVFLLTPIILQRIDVTSNHNSDGQYKEVTVRNWNFVLGSNPNEHRMEIEKEIVYLL